MAEPGNASIKKKQSPARWEVGIFQLASTQKPDEIDEADYYGGVEWNSEERMGEAAMMGETEGGAAETAEDVQIGSFRGESECERSQRGLAVESGAAHACAGEKVGNRFQGLRILFGCEGKCQQHRDWLVS